jgi:hypothetical protein
MPALQRGAWPRKMASREFMRYATFRLCPASTLPDNTFRGCNRNYGERHRQNNGLLAPVGFNDERMTGFCEVTVRSARITEAFNLFLATIMQQESGLGYKSQESLQRLVLSPLTVQ